MILLSRKLQICIRSSKPFRASLKFVFEAQNRFAQAVCDCTKGKSLKKVVLHIALREFEAVNIHRDGTFIRMPDINMLALRFYIGAFNKIFFVYIPAVYQGFHFFDFVHMFILPLFPSIDSSHYFQLVLSAIPR